MNTTITKILLRLTSDLRYLNTAAKDYLLNNGNEVLLENRLESIDQSLSELENYITRVHKESDPHDTPT